MIEPYVRANGEVYQPLPPEQVQALANRTPRPTSPRRGEAKTRLREAARRARERREGGQP